MPASTSGGRVRRLAGRWATGLRLRAWALFRRGRRPGMLSVVVPVYRVEEYLGRCLDSLRRQRYTNVEILVVDDGSPDGSAALARRLRRRDPRIRLIRRPNGGLSAARNTGVRAAHGEYLVFLDGDDFVMPGAYAAAITSLRHSGSDFAVLPYRRWARGRARPPAPWIRAAHRSTRRRLNLAEAPWVLVDAVAWNKVYRRSFWDDCGVAFPDGLLYEDQALAMTVFAAAAAFDVLHGDGILWRLRADRSSISDHKARAVNIAHQAIAARDSLAVLGRLATPATRRERVRQLLNNNLSGFIEHIPEMDDEAWDEFRGLARLLAGEADAADAEAGPGSAGAAAGGPAERPARQTVWGGVEIRKKVVVGLARLGRRDLVEAFLAAGGWRLPLESEPQRLPCRAQIAAVLGASLLEPARPAGPVPAAAFSGAGDASAAP